MFFGNSTVRVDSLPISKTIENDLVAVNTFMNQYVLIIWLIFGFIGFVGNLFTYLQAELRWNTCCIYSLSGAIGDIMNLLVNVLPSYLSISYSISIPWYSSTVLCRLNIFLLRFFRQFSAHCLLVAIIDRFASTCPLTSPIRRILQLKFVPIMISLALITCLLVSISGIFFFEVSADWCRLTNPIASSVLYIILNGFIQPVLMLIFVFLTHRNIHRSRRRLGVINQRNSHQYRTQFIMMIFGQIFTYAFLTLQWIIFYISYTFILNYLTTYKQYLIIQLSYTISSLIYYFISVRPFYISLLTSALFRKTFIKGLMKLIRRHHRVGIRMLQTNTYT